MGVIAWVRKGACGWGSLDCCSSVCVGGGGVFKLANLQQGQYCLLFMSGKGGDSRTNFELGLIPCVASFLVLHLQRCYFH